MRDYFSFVSDIRSKYNEREDIEWSNFWIDKANQNINDRILLIGDSTARMVRSTLAHTTGKPVDLLASSSGLHDSLFASQIKCFFMESLYKYDTIFVQLGHHAEIGVGGGTYKELDWELFEKDFRGLCLFLKQYTNNIIIESIFYTVIPNKKCHLLNKVFGIPEKYDTQTNEIKDKKTEIEFRVAEELGLSTLDINRYMLVEGKKYRHGDHIHFEESAKPFICKKMIEVMSREKNNG